MSVTCAMWQFAVTQWSFGLPQQTACTTSAAQKCVQAPVFLKSVSLALQYYLFRFLLLYVELLYIF